MMILLTAKNAKGKTQRTQRQKNKTFKGETAKDSKK